MTFFSYPLFLSSPYSNVVEQLWPLAVVLLCSCAVTALDPLCCEEFSPLLAQVCLAGNGSISAGVRACVTHYLLLDTGADGVHACGFSVFALMSASSSHQIFQWWDRCHRVIVVVLLRFYCTVQVYAKWGQTASEHIQSIMRSDWDSDSDDCDWGDSEEEENPESLRHE